MLPLTRRSALSIPATLPFLAQTQPQGAPPARHLLSAHLTPEKIQQALLAPGVWNPYPKAADRSFWSALPQSTQQSLLAAANKDLGQPWPALPATVALNFKRNGNRTSYEQPSFARRTRLRLAVLAECVEAKGRFLDDILDGLWLICEESFWGVSAHIGAQKAGAGLPDVTEPIVDLFAAETANTMAWIDYLIAPQLESLSPLLRARLAYETRRRVLDPCHNRTDFWWMGLDPAQARTMNNWNPWINSNWLTAVLHFETDPGRRAADVHKIITSTDRFLDGYHPDGGCDEGPGYWGRAGASLFDILDLLHSASAGKLDFFSLPLVREIGAYIYRVHIAGSWYVNFADAPARVHPDPNLVWRYGKAIQDPLMTAHGAWLASIQKASPAAERPDVGAMGRTLDAIFHQKELVQASAGAHPPLAGAVNFPGTQVCAARMKQGSTQGFYVAAKGGHNAESHNHNDIGNFIVFHDGEPVFIDIGVETYTAKTFSSRRYEIWTMQSAWHNCPTINGVMQSAGRQFEARNFDATGDPTPSVSMDIHHAYPAEAGVNRYSRTITLNRAAAQVELKDTFDLAKRQSLELSLVTNRASKVEGPGRLTLDGGFLITFDPALTPVLDEHSSEDPRLRPVWGPVVRRIRLTAKTPPAQGSYTVIIRRP
jgi:hypothetical protein